MKVDYRYKQAAAHRHLSAPHTIHSINQNGIAFYKCKLKFSDTQEWQSDLANSHVARIYKHSYQNVLIHSYKLNIYTISLLLPYFKTNVLLTSTINEEPPTLPHAIHLLRCIAFSLLSNYPEFTTNQPRNDNMMSM